MIPNGEKYRNSLAVVSHTLNGQEMQGLVKGLELFFNNVLPIAVFVGDNATMKASGNLLKSGLHHVEKVVVLPDLNPESVVRKQQLTEEIFDQIDPAFLGLVVVADMYKGRYLIEHLHTKSVYSDVRQPGHAVGINSLGEKYVFFPDGRFSRED